MSKGHKIGDACKELDVQPYVLRYWETEFPFLRPPKGSTGPRVYDDRELGLIRRIKELLYEEGYTIAGAKKKLEAEIESGKPVDATRKRAKKPEKSPAKETAEEAQRRLDELDEKTAPAAPLTATPDEAAAAQEAGIEGAGEPATSLDTPPNERIETIARGLRALRDEAQEILDLLARGGTRP
jgi:DNA-binding transcriptional MerR regulator